MATNINTLKNWFKTASKPTQEQFWAWMDSYWHKDEKLSIAAIDRLSEILGSKADADQLAFLAQKDGSNIDVEQWKTLLGVGELPENVLTYDVPGKPGNGLTKLEIAQQYLKKPTFIEDLTAYNRVLLLNAQNETAYRTADSLGKNVANSSLTSVPNAGLTLGAPWTLATAGQPYAVTGLPNKSADATYNRFRVQDNTGKEAYADNIYQALKASLNVMTPAQAVELGQLFNGGSGSVGNINVNLISPPILQKIDSVEYILLRGTNLNLNATSKKIEILDALTNAVVYTVPDAHIQLYADGLSLIFQYNPKDMAYGEYKLRLTSGAKVYVTTLLIKCVQNVESINLNAITWEKLYAEGVTPNAGDVAVGGGVNVTTSAPSTASPTISFKSSQLFAQGEDFMIEFSATIGGTGDAYDYQDAVKSLIGIGYNSSLNNLVFSALAFLAYNHQTFTTNKKNQLFLNNKSIGIVDVPSTHVVTLIKIGNIIKIQTSSFLEILTISNNSGYSMFLQFVGRLNPQNIQMQILKAYKFS